LPYKGKGEDPGLQTADTDGKAGLGDAPHPNMPPSKAAPMGQKPAGKPKHLPAPKKLKEFYAATDGLTDAEFVAYMLEQANARPATAFVHDLHGEPFTPHPHEAMRFVSSLLHNPRMVARMVREVKESGQLDQLVAEMLDHPEFYKAVTSHLSSEESGPRVAGRMAKSMHDHAADFRKKAGLTESVAPALTDDQKTDGAGVIPQPHNGPDEAPEEPPAGGEEGGEGEEPGMMPLPHNHMIGAMKPYFQKDMLKACQDGNC
jgi:hypothetical protein